MKMDCLPKHRTLASALQAGAIKYNRKLGLRQFRQAFTDAFGVSPGQYLSTSPPPPVHAETPPLENPAFLRKRISQLEAELKRHRDSGESAALVKSILHGFAEVDIKPPQWIVEPPKQQPMFHGVPTLFLSDVHHGERVFTNQVNGANAFNMDISRKRLERTFKRATYLLHQVFQNPNYPGIVLPLGGDMVSGNIHEELRETNEAPIFEVVIDLAEILSAGIRLLAEEFGRVFVPCVVGNHGRLDKKPRAKYAPSDNYEYILYHMLLKEFRDDERVTILVSDSLTLHYRVYGTRYLLTHGHQFKGGAGIAGNVTPWSLGDFRLRKQMQSMSSWTKHPVEYDVMIFGHFHSYFPGRGFLVNGSVKGFDEYAKLSGFAFEPPQQALWLTNPEYGMTFNCAVYCEDPGEKTKDEKPWVSLPR
jgi:predicted phosphodiesterase